MLARIAKFADIGTDRSDLQVQRLSDLRFPPALTPKAREHGVPAGLFSADDLPGRIRVPGAVGRTSHRAPAWSDRTSCARPSHPGDVLQEPKVFGELQAKALGHGAVLGSLHRDPEILDESQVIANHLVEPVTLIAVDGRAGSTSLRPRVAPGVAPEGILRPVVYVPRNAKTPQIRGFRPIAGAGFEPATFGL